MNRQIRQLAGGLMVCYVVLFVALNYWQVGQEEELNARFDNTRAIRREFEEPRGPIITSDGVVAAQSVENPPDSQFRFQRVYPRRALRPPHRLLHVRLRLDAARAHPERRAHRLDRRAAAALAARADHGRRRRLGHRRMTFAASSSRSPARRSASATDRSSCSSRRPAPSAPCGASRLRPEPDRRTGLRGGAAVRLFYENYPGDPLLANAYQQRYMPGSTFKVLTTGIALNDGVIDLATFPDENQFVPPQTDDPIENFEGTTCGGDLTEVFARSCNIPFARIALDIGVDRMLAGVARWGVGEPLPIDLPRPAASTFGHRPTSTASSHCSPSGGSARTRCRWCRCTWRWSRRRGQRRADDEAVRRGGDDRPRRRPPRPHRAEVWKTPIAPDVAETLNGLMQEVARTGTASCCLQLDNGISVAAKTGTAQLNARGEPERSHAWIVAFAPAEDPQFAVAVTLLGTSEEINAGTGGRLAGPVAETVLNAALAGGGVTGGAASPPAVVTSVPSPAARATAGRMRHL